MKGGSPKHNYMKKLPSAVPLTKDYLSLSERIEQYKVTTSLICLQIFHHFIFFHIKFLIEEFHSGVICSNIKIINIG